MNNLTSYLFETDAIRVSPADKPFWYTSGTLSPNYVNTHFVYGSEADACELLKFIDSEMSNRMDLPKKLLEKIKKQYETNEIYKDVINVMVNFIKSNINVDAIDYISGGERRDWYFSVLIANLLQKPHLTIFKDLEVIQSDFNFEKTELARELNGANVLHIADLITEAGSYKRMWIPVIRAINGIMKWSVVVVDRLQGGKEFLESVNVESFSMVNLDKTWFETILKMGRITEEQYELTCRFIDNPIETMKDFLKANPEFIQNSLNADAKTAERARMCVESGIYND